MSATTKIGFELGAGIDISTSKRPTTATPRRSSTNLSVATATTATTNSFLAPKTLVSVKNCWSSFSCRRSDAFKSNEFIRGRTRALCLKVRAAASSEVAPLISSYRECGNHRIRSCRIHSGNLCSLCQSEAYCV